MSELYEMLATITRIICVTVVLCQFSSCVMHGQEMEARLAEQRLERQK